MVKRTLRGRIKNTNGIIALLIGIFLLLSIFIISDGNLAREALPGFDGDRDTFQIQLTAQDDRANIGNLFWMDIRVSNPEPEAGEMFVQCSILDQVEHPFLSTISLAQSVRLLSDNCLTAEPFTQTAKVSLPALTHEDIRFTIQVPNIAENGSNPHIFCEAFETCWIEGGDIMSSDSFKKPLSLTLVTTPAPNVTDPAVDDGDDDDEGDQCIVDSDCNQWFKFSQQECITGNCVDFEDAESIIQDTAIKAWAKEHKIFLLFMGFALIIFGTFTVFQEPKRPKFSLDNLLK